ncbi:hypothetical protein BC834DRAFT_533081 [Gloeopeniophorella convolvens]|nr:hypothetical protein BC834DRAFT_533081 [Gloeopeniophorella convolvens]
MKFTPFTLLASALSGAYAQNIAIGSPTDLSAVTPGSNLVVQVNRPNSLTGSQEVAIAISIVSCGNGPCDSPSDRLGSVLYTGGFDPQYPTERTPQDVPQQNFTVTVPSGLASGTAQLTVTHLSLVGAGPYPMFEIKNVTLKVPGA